MGVDCGLGDERLCKWNGRVRQQNQNQGVFFFQGEDGIRDGVASRGLGDGDKRQLKEKQAGKAPGVLRMPGILKTGRGRQSCQAAFLL